MGCRPGRGSLAPLQEDQVYNVALFVSSGRTMSCAVARRRKRWPLADGVAELPEGNPDNGPQLYNVTYGCTACHGNPAETGSNLVGPWLGGLPAHWGDAVGWLRRRTTCTSLFCTRATSLPRTAQWAVQGPPSPCRPTSASECRCKTWRIFFTCLVRRRSKSTAEVVYLMH